MIDDDLLDLAEHLAQLEPGKPKQTSLRRAVSTAYCAVFHALADLCARELVGGSKPWSVFKPIYQSLDHGAAKKYFERGATQKRLSPAVAQIGNVFVLLQEERIRADYDPQPLPYGRREALDLCAKARYAVGTIGNLPTDEKLALAVGLVTKPR